MAAKKPKDMSMCWTPETAPREFGWLYDYNERDVVTELEAASRLPDLAPKEFKIWQLDQRVNMRGMRVNRKGINDLGAIVIQARAKYNAELRTITNYQTDGLGRVLSGVESYTKGADMQRWMAQFGVYTDGLDEDAVADALARKDLAPAVRRVLEIRQLLAF